MWLSCFLAWIRSVHQCLTTVSYKVLCNCCLSYIFIPSRRLRQDDPLSPDLFIIAMDVLSQMLSLAQDINSLKGIKLLRRSPTIFHLFFANDTILFHASLKVATNLSQVINRFSLVSSRVVNYSKSSIKLSPNITDPVRREIIKCFNYSEVSFFFSSFKGSHLYGG